MNTIHKYQLARTDRQTLQLPEGAIFLHFDIQSEYPHVWANVDTEHSVEEIDFYVVGTGNPMPTHDVQYIGTALDGVFVWHLFYRRASDG